jgi:hypothetical protein
MSDRKPKRHDQPDVSTMGLVVISALGMLLTMYGLAAAYYENARFKAQYPAWTEDLPRPSGYIQFLLLAGLFLITFVVVTVGGRMVRKLYHRTRWARGRSNERPGE